MTVRISLSLLALNVCLMGCASSPTKTEWSGQDVGKTDMPTIEAIDSSIKPKQTMKSDGTVAFGAKPYRWWDPKTPRAETREGEVYLAATQTMRIVLAPYVDVMGDYHKRSEVIAVMKASEWWSEPPVPVADPKASEEAPPPPPPPPPAEQ